MKVEEVRPKTQTRNTSPIAPQEGFKHPEIDSDRARRFDQTKVATHTGSPKGTRRSHRSPRYEPDALNNLQKQYEVLNQAGKFNAQEFKDLFENVMNMNKQMEQNINELNTRFGGVSDQVNFTNKNLEDLRMG